MIAITLNKNISCENICEKIQKLVNEYGKNSSNLEDSILVIEIKQINTTNTDTIPKLEYNNISS
jgi:uncharacterized protein YihD (DUF1040 family)